MTLMCVWVWGISVQILQEEPFQYLKPTLKQLLRDPDMNKQRAATEFLAGILGAMKHWPYEKQQLVWNWLTPQLHEIFGRTIRPASLPIWASFLHVSSLHFLLLK